ncbi:hypothetical protein Tco_1287659 [Tanacetum coccineum]
MGLQAFQYILVLLPHTHIAFVLTEMHPSLLKPRSCVAWRILGHLKNVGIKSFLVVTAAKLMLLVYKLLLLVLEVNAASTKVTTAQRYIGAVLSSASSAVTYTSVYTDSEPGRVFWGADEEVSDSGSPRVIVLGYNRLHIQPIAPPSPDYIPGPEDPQTPPVLQDEDEHVFPVEEQPLSPVVSPTAKSPGYVVESDPEEYEDDETEDGPVDYPINEGDDGDDDDGDSSRDDANDEDEEEEEHLASADSVVVPTVELVSPPEGTEPAIPPPSTDISTTGARITIRL